MNNSIQQYPDNSNLSILSEENYDGETFWATQAQIAVQFQTTKQNVSTHILNAINEGELDENSVVKESFTTAADGKSYRTRFYNLDAIISVGYRVNSIEGTKFRIHATQIIKSYVEKKTMTAKPASSLELAQQTLNILFAQEQRLTAIEGHVQGLDHDVKSLMALYPDTYTVKSYFNHIGRKEPDISTLRAIGKLAKANSGRKGMIVRKAQEGAHEVWMYHESILREIIAGMDRDNPPSKSNQLSF